MPVRMTAFEALGGSGERQQGSLLRVFVYCPAPAFPLLLAAVGSGSG